MERSVPMHALGHVTKNEMRIDDVSYGFVHDYKELYDNALQELLESKESASRD